MTTPDSHPIGLALAEVPAWVAPFAIPSRSASSWRKSVPQTNGFLTKALARKARENKGGAANFQAKPEVRSRPAPVNWVLGWPSLSPTKASTTVPEQIPRSRNKLKRSKVSQTPTTEPVGALPTVALWCFIQRVARHEPGLVELIKTFLPDGKTEPLFVLNSGLRLVGRRQFAEAVPILRAALPGLRRRLGTYHPHCLEGIFALEKAKAAEAAKVVEGSEFENPTVVSNGSVEEGDVPEAQFRNWDPQ